MDDRNEAGFGGSSRADEVGGEDRERAHLEHVRIVEDAAKAHASASVSDAELIATATDRHHEEVVKPSLLPKPNSIDATAPSGVPDDDEDET